MEQVSDTIAALATPVGRGAVAIVRLSGPQAAEVARRIVGPLPPPRQALLRRFRAADGSVIDNGLVIYFPAPHSYTGEDVVELQGHGGQVVSDLLLAAARAAGARQAEAGEFSRRAYLNDRLDLAQAEAVADLIDAATVSAARAAQRSLSGEFSRRVQTLQAALVELRVRVEGALDFSDEDAQWFDAALKAACARARDDLDALLEGSSQGRRLAEGYVVAIAGQANAGKSTLLNRLAGADVAIVTDIPGTTRDPLREAVDFQGLPVTLVDTAGLREGADAIEREGVARARHAFERCELILYLADARDGLTATDQSLLASLPARVPRLIVYNKSDLQPKAISAPRAGVSLSAMTGAGTKALVAAVREAAGMTGAAAVFSTRSRHLEALQQTRSYLAEAEKQLTDTTAHAELAAEALRLAQAALSSICGGYSSEELLGRIFAGFCIGK